MTNTVESLRAEADKCEHQARFTKDRALSSELFDMTAKYHWLAAEVSKLQDQSEELANWAVKATLRSGTLAG